MDTQRLNMLFERYLADDLSADEQAELFRLLHDPANQEALERLLGKWWAATRQYEHNVSDTAGQRRIQQVMEKIQSDRPKRQWRWTWLAAACVTLIVSVALLWPRPEAVPVMADVKTHEITTSYGQQKTVRMPDGSIIQLNAGSILRYTDRYNDTLREVELRGEAFFDVAKNPEKRFIVHHAQLDIEVLGTSFNVCGFDGAEAVHVAVTSGSVSVKTPASDTSQTVSIHTLLPGQELSYNRIQQSASVSVIPDMKLRTAWKDGLLVLNGQAFAEVATTLERWYGVQVRFSDAALQRCRFTGEFRNLPVNKVLDLLALSASFTYRIAGKVIYIDGKACD